MIDLSRTRFVITAWPDNRWPVETIHWIEAITKGIETRPDNRTSITKKNIVCARNFAIASGALRSNKHFEHFVFLDKDVRPSINKTTRFLDLATDVKCCQVAQENKSAWAWPDDFHESIWSTSRHVLETIKPPWFEFQYNDDKTDMIGCICNSFRAKALEAGFTISHGGWAEHDRDRSWC